MAISETNASIRNSDDQRLNLIDVSSTDDSLITNAANPFHHQHSENEEELLCTLNSMKFEDAATKLQEWEREIQPNEIENPNKNSKCNLRNSLAWDVAFFTSAGVLDPEELSSLIEGVKNGEKHALSLPGIQEDVHRSCESISTFESNSLTRESVEADLFQDVRASIQKSSSRMSNVASANRKVPSRFQAGGCSKKVGMASCNKASSSNSPSAGMQGTGKLTKKNIIHPQLAQPVARREEPSISKQPKVLGKSSPSSTILFKRSSLGDLHVKSEKDKANRITGKVNSVTNTAVTKGSQVNGLKPTISSKSSSGLSVATKTKSTISTSSSSNLSSNIGKSPLNSLKRKVDAGTKKPLSSCSVVRTPSRIASRDKIASSNSSLSGLSSITKLSSGISPASSISNRSSESSLSTSMAKYRSNNSRTSFNNSSSRRNLPEIDARQGSNSSRSDSCLKGKETQDTGARTAASGMVLSPTPKKPSSLQLPSPKISFFDRAKSSVRTPHRVMQPRTVVPHSLSKHGAGSVSPSEGQSKAKLGKLQSSRTSISIESKEFHNQQTSNPIPLRESSDVRIKTSMALWHIDSSSATPMDVQNKMHLKAGVGNLDAKNAMGKGHLVGTPDLYLGSAKENSHDDDQVDCLTIQVGLMDINLKS